jgi:hypothetical protein
MCAAPGRAKLHRGEPAIALPERAMCIYNVHTHPKNVKELSARKRVATTRAAPYAQRRRNGSTSLLPQTAKWL